MQSLVTRNYAVEIPTFRENTNVSTACVLSISLLTASEGVKQKNTPCSKVTQDYMPDV